MATIKSTFILENNVYFVDYPDQDMDEATFLNKISELTGCGLLMDLHNLYANARNHHFEAVSFLEDVDLRRIVEVHIAGGTEIDGMYTDSHAGPCPEPVWQLLEHVVPRAPNLRGITFEFHDSYFDVLGVDGIRAQLARAREIWSGLR